MPCLGLDFLVSARPLAAATALVMSDGCLGSIRAFLYRLRSVYWAFGGRCPVCLRAGDQFTPDFI